MGNIESNEQRFKLNSIGSFVIMRFQPNRIRNLNESKNFCFENINDFNNKKKQNNLSININNIKQIKNLKNEKFNKIKNKNDKIIIEKQRSLSPEFSNNYESKSISQNKSSNNDFVNK